MDILTKDLLINFLLIIFPLLLLQIWFYRRFMNRDLFFPKWFFGFFSLTSIFLCIKFPFPYGKFILDLSAIPYILGVFYGGKKLIILLTSWALLIRYLVGDEGVLTAFILLTSLAIFLYFLVNQYMSKPLRQKLFINSVIVVLLITVALFVSKQINGSFMGLGISIKYIAINVLCMIFITILIEVIKMNYEIVQKVIKSEKLEVASHLAASISHEVRNPLTASKGFIQLSTDEDLSLQKRKEYLDFALKEIDTAVEIINEYLTFAKPAIEFKEEIIIVEEIQKTIKILTPLAKMNNVEIKFHTEANKNYLIIGERKKFGQCLVNILKNGIESMPNGGNLSVLLETDGFLLKIVIQDEGIGMTPKQISRLGEPYFSTKETGTGLGLMVSFSIVNEMGGNIRVKSTPSNGTCLTIYLQIAK